MVARSRGDRSMIVVDISNEIREDALKDVMEWLDFDGDRKAYIASCRKERARIFKRAVY